MRRSRGLNDPTEGVFRNGWLREGVLGSDTDGGRGLWRCFQAVRARIELTRGNPSWCGRITSWGKTFTWEWVSESDPQDTARSHVWSPMMGSDPRELLHPFLVRTRRKDRGSGCPGAPASRAVSGSWRSGLVLQQLWTHSCVLDLANQGSTLFSTEGHHLYLPRVLFICLLFFYTLSPNVVLFFRGPGRFKRTLDFS